MGKVFLYTGSGAGKTTNAIGLAIRTVGHGKKAVVIFFMKGWDQIGEHLITEKLAPLYESHLVGSPNWVDLRNPSEEDKRRAREGLSFAKKKLAEKPHLLVLDEINLAAATGLVDVGEVISLLDESPDETDIVMTGRYAPPALINRADFVNLVSDVKAPKEMYSRVGITY